MKTEIVLSFIFIPYKGCHTEYRQNNEQGMRHTMSIHPGTWQTNTDRSSLPDDVYKYWT